MDEQSQTNMVTATWNPLTGCTPVSPGCRRCHAKQTAIRMAGRYGYPREDPFALTYHPDRLDQPARWRKPRQVLVCSMGDLFHEEVPGKVIDAVSRVMLDENQHVYMVLTKRPERMAEWLASDNGRELVEKGGHVWLGVTAETQELACQRVPLLIRSWPGKRFLCLEPLLGPVDLASWLRSGYRPCLNWIIVGGETGPGSAPAVASHVLNLSEQCAAAGVPLYFKQWGGHPKSARGNLIMGEPCQQVPEDFRCQAPQPCEPE